MSTIRVRRINQDGDIAFGSGQGDYLVDIDAVAQCILTRIKLFLAEWWEDQTDGTPMFQKILGASGNNKKGIDALIQNRIIGSPYVTGILSLQTSLVNRVYSFYAVASTPFGNVAVTNQPQSQ